ncbi:rhodanese-like domain-containing protein [Peribacillus sp. NPDC097197]|uniref:rhodanese-like domain-containing protein n=1 Tax=unclassified Peribacillus TaxID=2675266 RepID=UPI0038180131
MLGTLLNILMIAVIVWFLYERFIPAKGIKQITTIELRTQLNNKSKQYIDVRTPNEFRGNHIKGFKNIPLYELQNRVKELSKDQEVFVICQSGMRSSKASKLLKKMGFKEITNVKGGMSAWH